MFLTCRFANFASLNCYNLLISRFSNCEVSSNIHHTRFLRSLIRYSFDIRRTRRCDERRTARRERRSRWFLAGRRRWQGRRRWHAATRQPEQPWLSKPSLIPTTVQNSSCIPKFPPSWTKVIGTNAHPRPSTLQGREPRITTATPYAVRRRHRRPHTLKRRL